MAAAKGAPPEEDGADVVVGYMTGDVPMEGVFVRAELRGDGLHPEIDTSVDLATRSAAFVLHPDTSLALGVHSGTLTLMACVDPGCHDQFSGSPHDVSYRVELSPRLQISTELVNLRATGGALGDSAVVKSSMPVTATVDYAPGGYEDWLEVSVTDKAVSVTADARMLSIASFVILNATLVLRAENPTQTRRVAIHLNLAPRPPGP